MNSFLQKDDNELLLLIKQNNAKALKKLYEKYYERLCKFSYYYVKSIEISEEVVSDVFLNIWLNRDNVEIKSSLKSYLFSSVRNRSINYLIKEKRNLENIEVFDLENLKAASVTPYEALKYKDLEDAIKSIIQKLPPQRRLIFRMSRIDGLKYKEIAEVLSISVNTVQNQMVKAVKFISSHYSLIKSLFIYLFFLVLK